MRLVANSIAGCNVPRVLTVDVAADLLTAEEVAQRLRVSESTVRRYISEGRLPAVQLGGRPHRQLRIARSDLEDALRRWGTR